MVELTIAVVQGIKEFNLRVVHKKGWMKCLRVIFGKVACKIWKGFDEILLNRLTAAIFLRLQRSSRVSQSQSVGLLQIK